MGHPAKRIVTPNLRTLAGKLTIEIEAQKYTQKALGVLESILLDKNVKPDSRIKAADLLLAYGHGRPVDRVAIASLNGTDTQDVSRLSTRDLIAYATRLRSPIESSNGLIGNDYINSESDQSVTADTVESAGTPGSDFEMGEE